MNLRTEFPEPLDNATQVFWYNGYPMTLKRYADSQGIMRCTVTLMDRDAQSELASFEFDEDSIFIFREAMDFIEDIFSQERRWRNQRS